MLEEINVGLSICIKLGLVLAIGKFIYEVFKPMSHAQEQELVGKVESIVGEIKTTASEALNNFNVNAAAEAVALKAKAETVITEVVEEAKKL